MGMILLIFTTLIVQSLASGQGFGQPCYSDSPCDADRFLRCDSPNKFDQGQCVCNYGMSPVQIHPQITECRSQAGQSCKINSKCVDHSTCQNGICICENGTVNDPSGYCRGSLGSPCTPYQNPSNCSEQIQNLACNETGVCGCPQYKSWSKLQYKCLTNIPLNPQISCSFDTDCIDNAACIKQSGSYYSSKACQCVPGFAKDGVYCSKIHGEKCSVDGECNQDYLLKCKNGKCDCQNSKTMTLSPEKGKCSRLVNTGEPCDPGTYNYPKDECVENAICHSKGKECVCNSGYFGLKNGTCGLKPNKAQFVATIGSFCFEELDCNPWIKLSCLKGKDDDAYGVCACQNGYEWNGKVCAIISQGSNCATYPHCGVNSICQDGICQCLAGYDAYQGEWGNEIDFEEPPRQCLANAVGSNCTSEYPCRPDMSLLCEDGKCKCQVGWTLSKNAGRCVPKIFSACTNDTACINNGICNKMGFCECASGYIPDDSDPNNVICKLGYGKTCGINIVPECHGGVGLFCNGEPGTCDCIENGYKIQQYWRPEEGRCANKKDGGFCGIIPDSNPPKNLTCENNGYDTRFKCENVLYKGYICKSLW